MTQEFMETMRTNLDIGLGICVVLVLACLFEKYANKVYRDAGFKDEE